ncbi:MAG: Mu transposase C-terminal domain-containing protein [Candidatus Brocadiae bacterium]|nr:Mu transposase C-terminal domain-containing protein [Candidatus Brocadiia bacterium]
MKKIPVTAAELLQVGHWFQREDRLFEIIKWDSKEPLLIQARPKDTDTIQVFTLTELFAPTPITRFAETYDKLVAMEGAIPGKNVDAATLPAHLVSKAEQIIETVETVQVYIEKMKRSNQLESNPLSLTDITMQACQTLAKPVSLGVYYACRRRYKRNGGDRGLIAASLRRSTYGKARIEPNAQHFIDTIIKHFYRSNPPMRAQTVYGIAQQLWHHNRRWWINYQQTGETGIDDLVEHLIDGRKEIDNLLSDPTQVSKLSQIKLPSRSWFYGYVSWFSSQPGDGAQAYIKRQGREDWENNFLVFDRFAQTATLPLQYVFADHYKLDVLHVDDEFREVLGRLWLTALIDTYSRAVLGLFLSYEDPNIESIQGALQHAIWPKKTSEFDNPWDCYGIPQRLFLDNAWAHHSYSMEDLIRILAGNGRYTQMELVFRPPYQARYGGLIERLFGNFSGQLRERLPGAILKPSERHWHNASQGACLLYRDVIRIVHQMVVDYLHTPHKELGGLSPHEKWLSGLQLMTPVVPPFTPQMERSFWRLYPETRVISHTGVNLFGFHYWASELAGLRGYNRQGCQRHFHLRYNPNNISRVALFEDGIWLGDGYARELRLPDGQYEAVSLWELNLAKGMLRKHNKDRIHRPHSWLIHLLETRELIQERQEEQKLIRRKMQQLQEQRRGRPPISKIVNSIKASELQETSQAMTSLPANNDPRVQLLKNLGEEL